MQPLVSIIMPCYNAERYVAQSIESVIAQTYQNWELLITDDCSTDNSTEIIERYCAKDNRINLLKSDKHQGIAETRNLSINRAKGRFVAFLDSDDVWINYKIEKQIGYMKSNNYGFTFTSYEIIDIHGVAKDKIVHASNIMDYWSYMRNTIICCSSVILDKEKTGDFSTPIIETSQDMSLWLSILKKDFKAYPIDEILLKYRISPNSASHNKIKASMDVWRVFRNIEKLSFLNSLINFICYAYNAVKKRLF